MCQRGASWSSTSSSSRCKQRNFSSQICPINPWLTCYFSLLCCSAYYTPHFSNKIAWGRKCGNSIFFFLRFASKFTVHCKRNFWSNIDVKTYLIKLFEGRYFLSFCQIKYINLQGWNIMYKFDFFSLLTYLWKKWCRIFSNRMKYF